jgi:hypothetical protein
MKLSLVFTQVNFVCLVCHQDDFTFNQIRMRMRIAEKQANSNAKEREEKRKTNANWMESNHRLKGYEFSGLILSHGFFQQAIIFFLFQPSCFLHSIHSFVLSFGRVPAIISGVFHASS